MAERMIESNYQAMLEALYHFASRTGTLASNMQTLALIASSALEDEDTAVPAIYKQIRDCTVQYSNLADQAQAIAASISKELELGKTEHTVWDDGE